MFFQKPTTVTSIVAKYLSVKLKAIYKVADYVLYRVSVLCVPKLLLQCVKTIGDKPILFFVYWSGIYGNLMRTKMIELWVLLTT